MSKYIDADRLKAKLDESEDVVWLNWYNFNELARYFYELGLKSK